MTIQYEGTSNWWFSVFGMLLLSNGVGMGAIMYIVQPPEPDCFSESTLGDSAIYCATSDLNDQDADSLSRGIQYISTISDDSPLRSTRDRLLEKWSNGLLSLGEKAFQEGNLAKAVETAKMIPVHLPIRKLAESKIDQWNSTWVKAEGIYEAASVKMEKKHPSSWYSALSKAKELQRLGNEYWGTVKYQELVYNIQDIREQDEKKQEQEKKAAKLALKNQDDRSKPKIASENTSDITSSNFESEQKAEDLARLNKAKTLASSGKIDDLRAAINEASLVISDMHYQEARKLIDATERKIAIVEDNYTLAQAKKFAQKNDIMSLETAVSQASLISQDRPLYKEASQQIAEWDKKISFQRTLANNIQQKTTNTTNDVQVNLETQLPKLEETFSYTSEPQANNIQLETLQFNGSQQ